MPDGKAVPLPEIFVSVDIETDGPAPGLNSMLAFGAVALDANKMQYGTYAANLHTLPTARPHPKTMKWWGGQAAAWSAIRKDLKSPGVAMVEFHRFLKGLPGVPVFVGYPATFDFAFINYYFCMLNLDNPFSFHGLDIKTLAMAAMGPSYKKAVKRNMPDHWFAECPRDHTHIPQDDALEQGCLFGNILLELEVMRERSAESLRRRHA